MIRARLAVVLMSSLFASPAFATPDEDALREHCQWLERAIAREPNRDDAFGMFMHGQRPKCQAFIEALARGDGSVREDSLREVLKELRELREVIDAEHGGPPPELAKAPDPAADRKREEQAKREAAERKAREEAEKKAREVAERKAREDEAKARETERKAQEAAGRKAQEEEAKAQDAAARKAREDEAKARESGRKAQDDEAKARESAAKQREADEADARRLIEEAEREAAGGASTTTESGPPAETRAVTGSLDGTWEQLETKVLDKWVKRTLNLFTRDGVLEGELYEEVWFSAPKAWRDTSCGGKDTFRMVTTARVSGKLNGGKLKLSREVPRILTCTCGARCTVESRRRGMELAVGAQGKELADESGAFLRPGAKVVSRGNDEKVGGGIELYAGTWETRAYSQRDRKVTQRLELTLSEGRLTGTLYEKSTQALPLESWSERFCGGSRSWDWVAQWRVEGKLRGSAFELTARDGSLAFCSCPSKCAEPKSKLSFEGELGPTGLTLELGEATFERR